MNIDWSKAPAHATHWCPGNARIEAGWIYHNGGGEFYSCYADKGLEHIPSFPAWRALRLIPRPVDAPVWTGEGLPPVGIDVEIHNKTGLIVVEGAEGFIGSKCTVMATFTNIHGYEIVSVEDDSGSCMCFRAHMCFPVRTPEQIAADERKGEIDAMYRIFYDAPGLASQEGIAALYDAGYRKQPAP